MIILPNKPLYFPHPYHVDEHGILAVGGNVDHETLIMCYTAGIFPWSNPDDPILWWYTHPRMILYPTQIKVSKSMRQLIKKETFRVTMNQDFEAVINQCQQIPRKGQLGTWLHESLKTSVITLHQMGYAHSVEVWEGKELVGGLYGISIGKIFCGESMFAHKSNASKLALIHLAQVLERYDFRLIDCQQETEHLISMGAESVGGGTYLDELRHNALVDRLYLKECLETNAN